MKFLSIDFIKQHCRIDFDCEDALLEMYGDSAEETIAGVLGRGDTVDEMVESLTNQYGKIPADIYHAALMLVDVSYNERSVVSPVNMYQVPYGFDLKVKKYIRLTSEHHEQD